MKFRTTLAGILLASAPSVASAQSWLCIADMATGFSFNTLSKKWEHAKFKTDTNRYIIKPSTTSNFAYEVNKFGVQKSLLPDAWCREGVNEYGFLFCEGMGGKFKFNKESLRYISTYELGYVEIRPSNKVMREGGDTPSVEIGRCSAL